MARVHFEESDELERLATALIEAYHPHLEDARIRYLFRSKPQKIGGAFAAATATKVPSVYAFLAKVDFIIQVHEGDWDEYDEEQRVALMDHELMHCGVDENGWCLIPHDLEEFNEIVERRGEWDARIQNFIAAWRKRPEV